MNSDADNLQGTDRFATRARCDLRGAGSLRPPARGLEHAILAPFDLVGAPTQASGESVPARRSASGRVARTPQHVVSRETTSPFRATRPGVGGPRSRVGNGPWQQRGGWRWTTRRRTQSATLRRTSDAQKLPETHEMFQYGALVDHSVAKDGAISVLVTRWINWAIQYGQGVLSVEVIIGPSAPGAVGQRFFRPE